MDDEPRLPIAIGAAIEVRAQVQAARGNRSEAVYFLRREADTYKDTSILQRINKNINLLSLEGQPAFEMAASEALGGTSPTLASLKGKPVVLFLWAHWCPDCKAMSPILDEMRTDLRLGGPDHRVADAALWLRRQARARAAGPGARLHQADPPGVLPVDGRDTRCR